MLVKYSLADNYDPFPIKSTY